MRRGRGICDERQDGEKYGGRGTNMGETNAPKYASPRRASG